LNHLGYFVVRQARSAFPDLIALRQGEIILIECRVDGRISREERRRLLAYAEQVGGKPSIAYRKGRRLLFKPIEI